MPLTSVVLPCYNGSLWISDAIESVLHQTFFDFELIIVDDGSSDNSKDIISSHLCDGRVRYIYQENKGFSATINRGIKESVGDLIGFIGQDDLWLSNKLELQVRYFSKHNSVGLVRSNYYSIDSEGRIMRLVREKMPSFYSRQKMIEHLFLRNFIGFETVLVKKKCFDEVSLFDERMTGFSDHDMWLRIVGSFDIGYLDMPLVKKREHTLQLSKVKAESVLRDEFLIVKKAINRYPFLKKVERRKLALLYYALGIALLQKGNADKAKKELLEAIKWYPWKLKAVVAYVAPTLYTFALNDYQGFAQSHRGLSWVEG
jgi:glycosyltransferase involved in cell wall biosynthesis